MKKHDVEPLSIQEMQSIHGGDGIFEALVKKVKELLEGIEEGTTF